MQGAHGIFAYAACKAKLPAPPDTCQAFSPACRYVSLFPLLMQLLEADSPHLKQQLDLLRDPEQLWTPYGLRYVPVSAVAVFGHAEAETQFVGLSGGLSWTDF